jgi:hypothetical protein
MGRTSWGVLRERREKKRGSEINKIERGVRAEIGWIGNVKVRRSEYESSDCSKFYWFRGGWGA